MPHRSIMEPFSPDPMRYEPNSPIPLPADELPTAPLSSDAKITELEAQVQRFAMFTASCEHFGTADHHLYLDVEDLLIVNKEIDSLIEQAQEYNRDYLLAEQELEDFEGHQFGE